MSYLSIHNWARYQHYKTRNPPWIKLYTSLLEDYELQALPLATQLLYTRLLLVAARNGNATRSETEALANDTRMPIEAVREGIPLLLKGGWLRETQTLRRASKTASNRASKIASTRREEKNSSTVVEGRSSSPPYTEPGSAAPNGATPGSPTPGDKPSVPLLESLRHFIVTTGYQYTDASLADEIHDRERKRGERISDSERRALLILAKERRKQVKAEAG